MPTFEFTLRFELPTSQDDPEAYLGALAEHGCRDATVGIGRRGWIALEFAREAKTREEARSSAIAAVELAIPGVRFTEVGT